MTTATEFLTDDHRACDALWAEVECAADDAPEAELQAGFERFAAAMARHFDFEEGVLFPAFEAATGMTHGGPTFVMRSEHHQMRRVLDGMAAAVNAGARQALLDAGDTLLMLVQQHNVKEEHMLYPACDAHLGQGWAALQGRFPATR